MRSSLPRTLVLASAWGFLVANSASAVSEVRYRVVAQSGTPAPGMPAGVNFSGFSNPRINDAGQVVFRAGVTGTGVSTVNDRTLWSEGGGSLHLAAQEGTAAPGAGIGVNFGEFLHRPDISNAGQTAFHMTLNGAGIDESNDGSIWIDSGGGANLFLRDGFSAPGMGEGITFGSVGLPTIARSGEIMFYATLSGAGIDATNDFGIWSNSAGSLHPVV